MNYLLKGRRTNLKAKYVTNIQSLMATQANPSILDCRINFKSESLSREKNTAVKYMESVRRKYEMIQCCCFYSFGCIRI